MAKSLRLILAVALLCPAAIAGSSGTVSGHVSDSEGAAIKGVHLVIHWDGAGQRQAKRIPDVARETDATGSFEIELEPGFYDVCAMSMGFTPECKKVVVEPGQTTKYAARLKADPLVTKHLGDTF